MTGISAQQAAIFPTPILCTCRRLWFRLIVGHDNFMAPFCLFALGSRKRPQPEAVSCGLRQETQYYHQRRQPPQSTKSSSSRQGHGGQQGRQERRRRQRRGKEKGRRDRRRRRSGYTQPTAAAQTGGGQQFGTEETHSVSSLQTTGNINVGDLNDNLDRGRSFSAALCAALLRCGHF